MASISGETEFGWRIRETNKKESERKTSSSSLPKPKDSNTEIQRRPETQQNAFDTAAKEQEIKLRIAFWLA